jgi:type II secretory pathway pseudopilin PulG
MGTTKNAGFTIIETMLFLAITGVMVATLLVGVGASINVQRYQDSVLSLKSLLQSQYSSIENVENSRDNNWKCDSSARTSQTGTLQAVGQSDCIIIGRYVEISGSDITVATVTGYKNPNATPTGNDINIIKTVYVLGLSGVSQDKETLEWGTSIAWPVGGGTGTRSTGIMILRSPDSGSIYTFTTDTPVPIANTTAATLNAMIIPGTLANQNQRENTICVDPQGLVLTGTRAVVIRAGASSALGVETRTNEVMQTLGVTTRC